MFLSLAAIFLVCHVPASMIGLKWLKNPKAVFLVLQGAHDFSHQVLLRHRTDNGSSTGVDHGLVYATYVEAICQFWELGRFNTFSTDHLWIFHCHLMSQQHSAWTIWATWSDEHLQMQRLVKILEEFARRFVEPRVTPGYHQNIIDQCIEFMTRGDTRILDAKICNCRTVLGRNDNARCV